MHKRPQAGYGNFTHFINTAGGVALPVRDTSGLPVRKIKNRGKTSGKVTATSAGV